MTESTNGNGRSSELPRLPGIALPDLTAALPFLRAPFPAELVEFQARRLAPSSPWATVFATVSVWYVEERLDLFVGPTNWEVGEPVVFDERHVTRTLTVFGERRGCIGDGDTRLIQAATAEKRCAVHFGIARYLKVMRSRRMPIGEGENQLPVTRKGSPYIPDHMLERLKREYTQELARLAGRFGSPLQHPGTSCAPPASVPAASNGATGNGQTPTPNQHGLQVRNAAAAHGLDQAQLANEILIAAGEPPRSPARAAAVLDRLLAGMPADIGAHVLRRLVDDTQVDRPQTSQPAPGPTDAAGTRQSDSAPDRESVTLDFSTLGPASDRQAA